MHIPANKNLANKHILLGVTGSIAAYKAAELVRRLREGGAEVRVVLSAGGAEFVTPLTFQALSGNPVHSELLDTGAEAAMGHIELARWADAVVVAPASANVIARLAQGRVDDLLAAVCLATEVPVAVAPAMNQQMWANAATQDNLQRLRARGVHQFGPAEGGQACGETGLGRMLEADDIARHTAGLFDTGALAGLRVLVTAGPTQEAIDPVRYLSNRSSGRMGYAMAQAAAEAGAQVALVSGPTALITPPCVERIDVRSAEEMHRAVLARATDADIFIATAAVADYRPVAPAQQKIKKTADSLSLELVRNPDILADVAALTDGPLTVGFAAETENLLEHARDKLAYKGLDMIAANRVGNGLGFEAEENALSVIDAEGVTELAQAPKAQLARRLIALVAERHHF
ncbi:Phosphopantothenoylcysteine decarboxylase / Phosphopantothenoylcysteine synthetase [hydrothermal vent metagenome]|uniref:Phosphopantothenoylcysteine decarboxylase / Phosphopantothenoylcysteine synthetase n=1 Tax=hydrothermal vent metagenome TaxID=652676 RepID=A0A3B0ZH86_9ZZZZ